MSSEVPLAEHLAGYLSEAPASLPSGTGAARSLDSSQRTAPAPSLAARRDSPSPVRAQVVKITPKLARGLLNQRNHHNRDVAPSRVAQYERDILRGDWKINGEAIKIDWNGQVLDGQHRLLAVAGTGIAIWSVLVTGLDPVAQESMDQGLPRGFHDVLKLRGEKDPNVLAAAVKPIATYERDGVPFARGFSPGISNQQASQTLERNPELRDALTIARRDRKPWMPVSNMTALYFLFASVDEAAATAFLHQLYMGESMAPQVARLRELLVTDFQEEERRTHLKIRMVYVVIAWNAWRAGHYYPEFKWTMNARFPGIHGLSRAGD